MNNPAGYVVEFPGVTKPVYLQSKSKYGIPNLNQAAVFPTVSAAVTAWAANCRDMPRANTEARIVPVYREGLVLGDPL